MKRALLLLLLAATAQAATCKEACQHERGYKKRMLDSCLAEAAKAPPDEQGKVRLECRHRAVLPDCDGLPPCPEGGRSAAGIEVVSHFFSGAEDGPPMREAVFHAGETVFFRYQGLLVPDPAASDLKLTGDAVLRSGDRLLQTHAKDVRQEKHLGAQDHELPQQFTGKSSFALPKDLLPGDYVVELRLKDAGSRLDVTRAYRFKVEKPAPAKP
jgi:hypothetical protein